MNSDRIEGNWKEMKGKVQQELVGKIQQAYGKSRDEAEKEVDGYFN